MPTGLITFQIRYQPRNRISEMTRSQSTGAADRINRIIRENRVAEYRSTNLALGMRPLSLARADRQLADGKRAQSKPSTRSARCMAAISRCSSTNPLDRNRLGAGRRRMGGYGGTQVELPARGCRPRPAGRAGPGDQAHPRVSPSWTLKFAMRTATLRWRPVRPGRFPGSRRNRSRRNRRCTRPGAH